MTRQYIPQTKREYYNQLVKAARDGTFPSRTSDEDGGFCKYRLDGTPTCPIRCAAGLLIPDEEYQQSLEGCLVYSYSVEQRLRIPRGMTLQNVRDIQRCHDILAKEEIWDPETFIRKISNLECFQDLGAPEHVELGGEG